MESGVRVPDGAFILGYRQAVRHWILIPVFVGSNPTSPVFRSIYERINMMIKELSALGFSISMVYFLIEFIEMMTNFVCLFYCLFFAPGRFRK